MLSPSLDWFSFESILAFPYLFKPYIDYILLCLRKALRAGYYAKVICNLPEMLTRYTLYNIVPKYPKQNSRGHPFTTKPHICGLVRGMI